VTFRQTKEGLLHSVDDSKTGGSGVQYVQQQHRQRRRSTRPTGDPKGQQRLGWLVARAAPRQRHLIYTDDLVAAQTPSAWHCCTNRGSRVIGLVGRSIAAPDNQPNLVNPGALPSSAPPSSDEHVDDRDADEEDDGTDRDASGRSTLTGTGRATGRKERLRGRDTDW